MSNQYPGGYVTKTPVTPTVLAAPGIWTMAQQSQYRQAGTWPETHPTTIGQAYGGGYYGGKINDSGTQYYLVVAPKATGETIVAWGPTGVGTGAVSYTNGPANSAALAALGSSYAAANFCEGLTIGGYSDWYLPARNELEVLYYFLKPSTTLNDTSSGSNANAVSPEPISTNYTLGSPAQTASGINFRLNESEAFAAGHYWSSTETGINEAWQQYFSNGYQYYSHKDSTIYTRAVRRIAV